MFQSPARTAQLCIQFAKAVTSGYAPLGATLTIIRRTEKLDMVAVCNNNGGRAAAILACAARKASSGSSKVVSRITGGASLESILARARNASSSLRGTSPLSSSAVSGAPSRS